MPDSNKKTVYIVPPVIDEKASVVHSSCYRLALSILRRASHEPVTVPIDAMGYTALIYENRILFADNSASINHAKLSGYPVIMEWQFFIAEDRNHNDQHIPMQIRFHSDDLTDTQQQLTGEFYKAMMHIDQQFSAEPIPSASLDVISMNSLHADH
ncbi:MAG: hypothetical protein HKP55_00745 [Gammaproteobacteria bacterium]|nr:hypothetical protein [Gammaproteobacteria bacterium]